MQESDARCYTQAKRAEITAASRFRAKDDLSAYSWPFIPWAYDGGGEHFRDWGTVLNLLHRHPWRLGQGAKILDLGVGIGWTSIFLAHSGFSVTGLDIAPDYIEVAREKASRANADVNFVVGDMESFELGDEYDAVLILDALHHCERFDSVLDNCFRALKSGGVLALGDANWLHTYSPRVKHTAHEYGFHERGFSRWHLTRALKGAGFTGVYHFHDPGSVYSHSLWDFTKTLVGLLAERIFCFPQRKVWIVAVKE